MESHVLNPCPKCGKRFDFPLTGCMTFVAETLLLNSNGKCPECGTKVVVEQPPQDLEVVNPLRFAETRIEKLEVKVIDLPLSVRCRLQIHRMNVDSLGELLQRDKNSVRTQLAECPNYFEQIEQMLAEHELEWQADCEP